MAALVETNCKFIKFNLTPLFATDPISYQVLHTKKPAGLKAEVPKQLATFVNNGIREIFVICDLNRVVVSTEDHKFIRSFSVLKSSLEIEDDDEDKTDSFFKPVPEEYDAIALNVNPTISSSNPEIYVGGFRSHVRVYDIYGKFLRKFRINECKGSGYVNRLNILHYSREIAVSDCYSNEIRIYGFEGTLHRRIQSDEMNCPADIVNAPNGNYLVANMLANNVLVFAPDGTFLRSFGEDFLKEPSAMALHGSSLFVGCNDAIHILDSSYINK